MIKLQINLHLIEETQIKEYNGIPCPTMMMLMLVLMLGTVRLSKEGETYHTLHLRNYNSIEPMRCIIAAFWL